MLRCRRRRASSSSHGRSVSSVGKGNEGGVIVPKQLPNGKASRQSSDKLRVASYMFGDCSYVDCAFLSHARVTKSICKHRIHRTLEQNFRSLEGRKRKNKKVRVSRRSARSEQAVLQFHSLSIVLLRRRRRRHHHHRHHKSRAL